MLSYSSYSYFVFMIFNNIIKKKKIENWTVLYEREPTARILKKKIEQLVPCILLVVKA